MHVTDHTHDAAAESWVESANRVGSDFSLPNLPYCTLMDLTSTEIGVGIGDWVVRLKPLVAAGAFERLDGRCLTEEECLPLASDNLRSIMSSPVQLRQHVRLALWELLHKECSLLRDDADLRKKAMLPLSEVKWALPCPVGDYTDFYASVFHATNVGSMFRPDHPLLPNYKWIPVGYHGRASSVVVSDTAIRRPIGQTEPLHPNSAPVVKPSALLDYELEMGLWIAGGNQLGCQISMSEADNQLFGLSLLNDWSARDIQKWEYQPLGPFLGKSFATSISPWVVTARALTPFRVPAFARPMEDPQPLPHLDSAENREFGGFDVTLDVYLSSQAMREAGHAPLRLSRGNLNTLYWTAAQMITHHTSNGCNLSPGDLLGSGTVSGPNRDARGCLLELTWDGDAKNILPGSARTAISLPTGEERKFLSDGDEVTIVGFCDAPGRRRIGFGECRGTIQAALASNDTEASPGT